VKKKGPSKASDPASREGFDYKLQMSREREVVRVLAGAGKVEIG